MRNIAFRYERMDKESAPGSTVIAAPPSPLQLNKEVK